MPIEHVPIERLASLGRKLKRRNLSQNGQRLRLYTTRKQNACSSRNRDAPLTHWRFGQPDP
jgi:hypothetical protein